MNKKVLVEKIGHPSSPAIQTELNYNYTNPIDPNKPRILAYSVIRPPITKANENVISGSNYQSPSSTIIVRDNNNSSHSNLHLPSTSGYQTSIKCHSEISPNNQRPPKKTYAKRSYSSKVAQPIPLQNKMTKTAGNGNTQKQNTSKGFYNTHNIDGTQKVLNKRPTSQIKLATPGVERSVKTSTPRIPLKQKSIVISRKNLTALDEESKKKLSASSSVANFLEKDTLQKGLEVLDSLDDTSLTVLVTKVMDVVNKMYGNYLEEELTAHLGADTYRQLANQGLTTFSEFLAQPNAMVLESSSSESPRSGDIRGSTDFSEAYKYLKRDPRSVLMKSNSPKVEPTEPKLTIYNSKIVSNSTPMKSDSFAEADEFISEKLNSFKNLDMYDDKFTFKQSQDSKLPEEIFDTSFELAYSEISLIKTGQPKVLLQVDGMDKNGQQSGSFGSEQNEPRPENNDNVEKVNDEPPRPTLEFNKNSSKGFGKIKNRQRSKTEDNFNFDPLLSKPSESILEVKSVVTSSPEISSSQATSRTTSESRSSWGSLKKFDGLLSPLSKSPGKSGEIFGLLSKTPSPIVKNNQKGRFSSPMMKAPEELPGFKPQLSPRFKKLLVRMIGEEGETKNIKAVRVEEDISECVQKVADCKQSDISSEILTVKDSNGQNVTNTATNIEIEEKDAEINNKVRETIKEATLGVASSCQTEVKVDTNKEHVVLMTGTRIIEEEKLFIGETTESVKKTLSILKEKIGNHSNNLPKALEQDNFNLKGKKENGVNTVSLKQTRVHIDSSIRTLTALEKGELNIEERKPSKNKIVGETPKHTEKHSNSLLTTLKSSEEGKFNIKEEKHCCNNEKDVRTPKQREMHIDSSKKTLNIEENKLIGIQKVDEVQKQKVEKNEKQMNTNDGLKELILVVENIEDVVKNRQNPILNEAKNIAKPLKPMKEEYKSVLIAEKAPQTKQHINEEVVKEKKCYEEKIMVKPDEKATKDFLKNDQETRSATLSDACVVSANKKEETSISNSPDIEQSVNDLAQLLISFQESGSFAFAGFSNDSFESFAQKTTVTIEDVVDLVDVDALVETDTDIHLNRVNDKSLNSEESENDFAKLLMTFQENSKSNRDERSDTKASNQDAPKEEAKAANNAFENVIIPGNLIPKGDVDKKEDEIEAKESAGEASKLPMSEGACKVLDIESQQLNSEEALISGCKESMDVTKMTTPMLPSKFGQMSSPGTKKKVRFEDRLVTNESNELNNEAILKTTSSSCQKGDIFDAKETNKALVKLPNTSTSLTVFSDDEDNDCIFLSETVGISETPLGRRGLRSVAGADAWRNGKIRIQHQRNILRKKASVLSKNIRSHIRNVKKTYRNLNMLVNLINLEIKDTSTDNTVLRQKVKNLNSIFALVTKTILAFNQKDASELKVASRKLCMAQRGGWFPRLLIGRNRRSKNVERKVNVRKNAVDIVIDSEKMVDNLGVACSNKPDIKVEPEPFKTEVSEFGGGYEEHFPMKPLKTYSKGNTIISRTKSEPDLSVGNKNTITSLFPNKSELFEKTEDSVCKGTGSSIVHCFIYKEEKIKGEPFDADFDTVDIPDVINLEPREPNPSVFIGNNPPSGDKVIVKKELPKPINKSKRSDPLKLGQKQEKMSSQASGRPSPKVLVIVNQECPEPADEKKNADVIKRGQKRKRNTDETPAGTKEAGPLNKAYSLRKDAATVKSTLPPKKKRDKSPLVQSSYSLRTRRTGNNVKTRREQK